MSPKSSAAFALDVSDDTVALEMMGLTGVAVNRKAFSQALTDDYWPASGILPPCIRWVSPSRRIWLLERPPTEITVRYTNAKLGATSEAREYTFDIRIPWMVYLIDLDQTYYPERIYAYTIRHSLTRTNNSIGILPIANFSADGKLCQPHRSEIHEQPRNASEGIALAYRLCWGSGFNMDLNSAVIWSRLMGAPQRIVGEAGSDTKALQAMRNWAKLSMDEVLAIDDWAPPVDFDWMVFNWDAESLQRQAVIYGTGKRSPRTISMALDCATRFDIERRSDWGSRGLLLSLQMALGRASLLE